MPITNEEFIKKAFASGLTPEQVRSAVAERNSQKTQEVTPQEEGTGFGKGLYNLVAKPTIEGLKGGAEWIGATGGTLLGSMLSNSATGNTQQALKEAEALKQARLSGNTDLSQQLAGQSRQRYQTGGQVSNAMLQGGQDILSKTNELRQRTGMGGSFDQGLMSGLTTAGIGTLKGASGALALYDLLGIKNAVGQVAQKGGALIPAILGQVASKGTRNALINAPLYGVGNVAQDIRTTGGENLGQSAWEGITGSKPIGPAQGITGDETIAPLVDTALSLGIGLSKYGKWTEKMATSATKLPSEAWDGVKRLIPEKNVEEVAGRIYGQSYGIPARMAREMKPNEVFKEMVRDGVVGTPDQVKERVGKITGKDGIFTELTNGVAKSQTKPIDLGSAKVESREYIKNSILDGKKQRDLSRQITNQIDQSQKFINEGDAFSALKKARDLEKQGYALKNAGESLFNKKPKLVAEGQAYIVAAKNITDQIDELSVSTGIIDQLKTDENISKVLEAGGPKVVEKFLNAKSFKDLRSIVAPYVKMGMIIDMNEAGNFSQLAPAIKQSLGKLGQMGVGGAVGSTFGPLGTLLGAGAGYVAQPTIEAIGQNFVPKVQGKMATSIYNLLQPK